MFDWVLNTLLHQAKTSAKSTKDVIFIEIFKCVNPFHDRSFSIPPENYTKILKTFVSKFIELSVIKGPC